MVTAFSERCCSLVKQCIVSLQQGTRNCDLYNLTVFAYECNWTADETITPFERKVDLQDDLRLPGISIIQRDASSITNNYTTLPDITAYHHFAENDLDNYDYTLFCHDDVIFNESINVIRDAIEIIDDPRHNLIAKPHLQAQYYMSVRFYPYLIFVHTKKFREANLSFCNDAVLIDEGEFKLYPLKKDGGAGLFNSYYSNANPVNGTFPIAPNIRWGQHIRFFTDAGVECYNILHPNTPSFVSLMQQADRYVDSRLFGADSAS